MDFITQAEEAALIPAAQEGDQAAQARLLEAYHPLLASKARRAASTFGGESEDFYQEAAVAFLEVVKAYEPRGGRLAAAAGPAVDSAIYAAVQARSTTASVPTRTLSRYRAAMRETSTLEEAKEYARRDGMSEETFLAVHAACSPALELDRHRYSPTGRSGSGLSRGNESIRLPADVLPELPTGFPEDEDTNLQARDLLGRLSERQRAVMMAAYGFTTGAPMTDAEVAALLGMTRPTVQRIRHSALSLLGASA